VGFELSSYSQTMHLQHDWYSGLLSSFTFCVLAKSTKSLPISLTSTLCISSYSHENHQYIAQLWQALHSTTHDHCAKSIGYTDFWHSSNVHKDILLAEMLYILDRVGFAIGIPTSPPVMCVPLIVSACAHCWQPKQAT
jgi:hypothetical protein